MIAKRIHNKHGRPVLDYNEACPFEAENDFEEALLFYMHKIGNSVEDMEDSMFGVADNVVEERIILLEKTLSAKLDAVIAELRQMNDKGV